jgi:hypothetical protein
MTHLRGMVVRLVTGNDKFAGTDNMIYIGVVGKDGGREFPLDVGDFDDFEKGTDIKYHLGTVWDGNALNGTKKPKQSTPGLANDPKWHRVDLNEIDYVYIRKEENHGDHAQYQMDLVEVTLYGVNPISRTFAEYDEIYLGKNVGLICYLPEA